MGTGRYSTANAASPRWDMRARVTEYDPLATQEGEAAPLPRSK